MIKPILICAFFVLFAQGMPEAENQTKTTYLKEVEIVGYPLDVEIYRVLTQGKDSVWALDGSDSLLIDVPALDPAMARLIVAQARHETGDFVSPLFTNHNNVYGMQHPGRGKLTTSLGPLATAEGRPNKYASYSTVEASVLDLMLWLQYHNTPKITTADAYCKYLKQHRYFEAPLVVYQNSLKHYLACPSPSLKTFMTKNPFTHQSTKSLRLSKTVASN